MPFDEAQFRRAKAERDELRASGKRPGPQSPLSQYFAALDLEQWEADYNSGNKMALLSAIRTCAAHDLAMSEWMWRAYISAYDKVLRCEAISWDAVFGKPYPGKRLTGLRKKRQFAFQIYADVVELKNAGAVTDEHMFQSVGSQYGISKTDASKWYYELRETYRLPESPTVDSNELEPRLKKLGVKFKKPILRLPKK